MPRYRFDELGWAQFELVCDELLAELGLSGLEWVGRADGIRVAAVENVPISLAARSLRGPTLVVVAAMPTTEAVALTALESAEARGCRTAVALTNHMIVGLARGAFDDYEILDTGALSLLIDAHPSVRRRVPSLLGVCDLPPGVEGSSWDRAAAIELAQVFVPTSAHRRALDALDRHNFAVVTGPPEMGKTAIARAIGLALELEGWAVHECIRPEQIFAAHRPDRPQLFVADDAFGSTEYDPQSAERWAHELVRILHLTDQRHQLIWTSRPAPLRAALGRIHREHGVERFPQPAQVQVDAAALDIEERATILLRHARASDLAARRIVRAFGPEIVEHDHFTPERIRRFVGRRLPTLTEAPTHLLRAAILAELAEPTAAMAASFDALSPEHRSLLVALVDTPAGPVSERDLAASVRRHAPAGLSRPPAELIDRLTDHFLRLVPPTSVTWVHPSWRDLVVERLSADPAARQAFLTQCSIEGVLLALSRGGGGSGTRTLPLLQADADWDALDERLFALAAESDDPALIRLLIAIEDSLGRALRNRHELRAIARTVLTRLARCWERLESYPTPALLEHWERLCHSVDEQLQLAKHVRVWEPEPGERFMPPEDGHSPLTIPNWEPVRGRIVERILADLA